MIYVQVHIKSTPDGFRKLQRELAEYNLLMARDGGKPIANFVVRIGNGTGDQVHLFAYPDMAAYAAAMDRMSEDAEWRDFLNRVGTIASSVDIRILKPLPESGLQ
jgi:hypothetical protein